MKILRFILSVVGVVLAGFMLISQSFGFMSYLMLVVGISILITGVIGLQKDTKAFWGYMSIIVSLFVFFVTIQGFVLN